MLPVLGAPVPSLGRELGCCLLHSMAKKKKEKEMYFKIDKQ